MFLDVIAEDIAILTKKKSFRMVEQMESISVHKKFRMSASQQNCIRPILEPQHKGFRSCQSGRWGNIPHICGFKVPVTM